MDPLFLSVENATADDTLLSQLQSVGLSPIYLFIPIICYLSVVALFRHHRLRQTLEDYPYTTRRSFRDMTNEHAFFIQQIIGELEFPFTFEKALQFALFRTYGIPSISKLLVETGEFSEEATSTKRYTDTSVIVAEIVGYNPKSERSIDAIGRMNYIHHQYRKSGKILNDDMLYTLSLFASEPLRWIGKYEWRKLEDFERCAIGTFWKAMGDAMGISYEKLKSGGDGGEGWEDGMKWLDEMVDWAEDYEKKTMVPNENNRKTAEHTVAILLWSLPNIMKPFGKKVVSAVMDDRLRRAMMSVNRSTDLSKLETSLMTSNSRFEKPPTIYFTFLSFVLKTRKLLLRFLFLPRPFPLRVHTTTEHLSKDGRYFMRAWETVPWYVQPTFRNRWLRLQSWTSWIMGLPVPGDEGDKYYPQGYRIREIGPETMRKKGEGHMREEREKLAGERMKGCPFARAKIE